MSVRLETSAEIAAPLARVWDELVDWPGQSRWIPFTTVRIETDHEAGLGVRATALSGCWLGRIPAGLLDRFVVTGWTPPGPDGRAELEVLHLGPYFTGEGVFALRSSGWRHHRDLRRAVQPAARERSPSGWAGCCCRCCAAGSRQPAAIRGRLRVATMSDAQPGPDGRLRCPWALSAPEYLDYHDHEWGQPVTGVVGLYERLSLEAFQSGLSWITILRKREGFRSAFAGFDPETVAQFDAD